MKVKKTTYTKIIEMWGGKMRGRWRLLYVGYNKKKDPFPPYNIIWYFNRLMWTTISDCWIKAVLGRGAVFRPGIKTQRESNVFCVTLLHSHWRCNGSHKVKQYGMEWHTQLGAQRKWLNVDWSAAWQRRKIDAWFENIFSQSHILILI